MKSGDNDNTNNKVYTVGDWLLGCVNFAVPEDAVKAILAERDVDASTPYAKSDVMNLLKADLYKWILLGAGRTGTVSDGDNGWSHSDGGYTLSEYDKKQLRNEANAIYKDNGETSNIFGKTSIKVSSNGVMRALRDVNGNPIQRIHKS